MQFVRAYTRNFLKTMALATIVAKIKANLIPIYFEQNNPDSWKLYLRKTCLFVFVLIFTIFRSSLIMNKSRRNKRILNSKTLQVTLLVKMTFLLECGLHWYTHRLVQNMTCPSSIWLRKLRIRLWTKCKNPTRHELFFTKLIKKFPRFQIVLCETYSVNTFTHFFFNIFWFKQFFYRFQKFVRITGFVFNSLIKTSLIVLNSLN